MGSCSFFCMPVFSGVWPGAGKPCPRVIETGVSITKGQELPMHFVCFFSAFSIAKNKQCAIMEKKMGWLLPFCPRTWLDSFGGAYADAGWLYKKDGSMEAVIMQGLPCVR